MKRWEGSISSNLAWLETNVKCVQKVNTKSPSYHLRLQVATLASIKIKVKNILEEKASIGWLAGKISGLSTVAWYNAGQNGHRLLSKLKHFIFGPPPKKKTLVYYDNVSIHFLVVSVRMKILPKCLQYFQDGMYIHVTPWQDMWN